MNTIYVKIEAASVVNIAVFTLLLIYIFDNVFAGILIFSTLEFILLASKLRMSDEYLALF